MSEFQSSNSESEPQAWIRLPTDAEVQDRAPAGVRLYHFGFVSAMSRLMLAHPRIGPFFVALVSEIVFGEGALTRAERELVAAVTAAAQDCHY